MQPPGYPGAPPAKSGPPGWVWGLVGCGCLGLIGFTAILAAILFPVFSQAREKARQTSCLSNLKQISLAVLMYAQDNDDTLPEGKHWTDKSLPYSKSEAIYRCPSVPTDLPDPHGYAYNSDLSEKQAGKLLNPNQISMLYDSIKLGRNETDPVTSLPIPGRHRGTNNMGYADGHVKAVRPDGSVSGAETEGP